MLILVHFGTSVRELFRDLMKKQVSMINNYNYIISISDVMLFII